MTDSYQFYVSCPKSVESMLMDELGQLGFSDLKETVAGVYCTGTLEHAYRACLWSRLANRVILQLHQEEVKNQDELYEAVKKVNWLDHMKPSATMKVDFMGQSGFIKNTQFGALKVKDAIVDQIRNKTGARPSIESNPDILVNAVYRKGQIFIGLDLSGGSLHRRGYRLDSGKAPLKENLAAAILIRAGWPEKMGKHYPMVDPMCGSGTLLIEGAMMAADIAPGLQRKKHGFEAWLDHDHKLWLSLVEEARERRSKGMDNLPAMFGFDNDRKITFQAKENVQRAGLAGLIEIGHQPIKHLKRPVKSQQGMLITNPPYGERLGEEAELLHLYKDLGKHLSEQFGGWQASIFTGNPNLGKTMGIRSLKQYRMINGTIQCVLLNFEIQPEHLVHAEEGKITLSEGAQMFANRLKKNQKGLKNWIKKESIEAYRLYDADMPEYAVAVDVYGNHVQVQEYAPPKSVDPIKADQRLREVVLAIPEVLDVKPEHIVIKQRQQQKGKNQYERRDQKKESFWINEHGAKLEVNIKDYLDTGVFLDHRPARLWLQKEASGKSVLNLFCYTGAATVHAGIGGAEMSVSVDMSKTYIDWAKRNFEENGFDLTQHQLVQENCFDWLKNSKAKFDLIFLDPPTFSNSKRMEDTFDVQRDHVNLILLAMARLKVGGTLFFSNNNRSFKMDEASLVEFEIKNVDKQMLPMDFKRNPKIHNCWLITKI